MYICVLLIRDVSGGVCVVCKMVMRFEAPTLNHHIHIRMVMISVGGGNHVDLQS